MQGATPLTDWGVIRAVGEDARAFLHSQLTQDTLHLEAHQARLAGFCSAKGRLQASFVVWRTAPDEVFLACSADLLPAALKRLSMFVLRSKCKLSDASAQFALWGLAGEAVNALLGEAAQQPVWRHVDVDGVMLVRLPDAVVAGRPVPRWLWASGLASDATRAAPTLPALDPELWRWLEVKSGTARIVAATVDQFVPQMINFELVGGVNFQKGCYPGQEIVARSQYRGTLKRRACVVNSASPLRPGQEVFSSSDPDQPAGMVVLAGSAGQLHSALVELKIAAMHGASLHAGSIEAPELTLDELPYTLPAEAA